MTSRTRKSGTRRLLLTAAAGLIVVALAAAAGVWWITRRTPGESFNSDGVRIFYSDEGSGPPVVLLHGFAVNSDLNWRLPGITPRLAREFRVISMDLRGHGLSGKPRDPARYGAAMAEDVVRLLDHLGMRKVQLVGYSLGGIVALKLAVTHPERWRSVVLMGAGWEDPQDSVFLKALDGIAADLAAGRGVPPLASRLGGKREPPGLLHTLEVRTMTRFLNDGPALAAMVRGLRGLAVPRKALRGISVPVCSIVGTRDPMRPGVDAMRGLVPDLSVVYLEGADHLSALRRPALQDALLRCLRQHAGPGGRGQASTSP